MKEERLIGNSGIQEVRQQCLDLLAEIREQAGILNDYFEVTDNPEYIAAWVDGNGKVIFGLRTDGKTFVGDADFLDDLKRIKEFLPLGSKEIDWDALSIITLTDNPEFLNVEIDEDGNILSSRSKDGVKKEYAGFETPKMSIDGHTIENIEDPEGRSEVTTDSRGKIISYRDSNGVNHENAGIETKAITLNGKDLESYIDAFTTSIEDMLEVKVGSESYVYSEKPRFGEMRFYGELPTDTSDERIPTKLFMLFKINNKAVFSTNCLLSIQGHGSTGYLKHNYTIDFLNADDDELAVKFGNMIAVDSFHLKGYYSDVTHSRGIGGMNWYREMVEYLEVPYNKINNIPLDISASQDNDCRNIADAQYGEQGFPFAMYLNDAFYGLYTLKLKKTRQNYAMQKSIKSEIFLDSIYAHADLDKPFDYTQWEVKNPKLKNYEEGGEIKDAAVLASINRLFGFLNDIDNQYENHADYIVLQHWLLDIIFVEVIGHRDFQHTVGNNTELLTWDNVHWSILPYDLDNTVGLDPWTGTVLTTETGLLTDSPTMTKIRTYFDAELKALYTKLRNNGVISAINGYRHYVEQCNSIPRDVYKADYTKWGGRYADYPSMEQVYYYLMNRIAYLDSEWLNNN